MRQTGSGIVINHNPKGAMMMILLTTLGAALVGPTVLHGIAGGALCGYAIAFILAL